MLVSLGFSGIVTLATTEVKYVVARFGFVALATVGTLVGVRLLVHAFRKRNAVSQLVDAILDMPKSDA
jgi:hypothetical protein